MDSEPVPEEQKPAEETLVTPSETPPETAPEILLETPPTEPPAIPEISSQAEQPPAIPQAPTIELTPQPVQPSIKSFFGKALESVQFRKKAKLEKIMKLAGEKRSITNDQVQKLLCVSDATATRYLSALVRQGRLKRLGISSSTRYEPTLGSIPAV